MMCKRLMAFFLFIAPLFVFAQQHTIVFCGENIPVTKSAVASKLMNVIRTQMPHINMPSIHQRALGYFPFVSSYLSKYNIPDDFKYLPIVESNFVLATSRVGARGIWQLMPETAKGYGLIVTETLDERDNLEKATDAACHELLFDYNMIFKKYNISSWVLAAAAYNFGIGNIFKNIQRQGTDYFAMTLNDETASYVYKIIAVKELFEYPELYMKDFGYNVFSSLATASAPVVADTSLFTKLSLPVSKKEEMVAASETKLIGAHIKGKYKDFHDGDLVTVLLDEDLLVRGSYTRKGTAVKGSGWIIDDRIYVDLGYGHDVLLSDINGARGISVNSLQNKKAVLLIDRID